jgi:hypothetical protein
MPVTKKNTSLFFVILLFLFLNLFPELLLAQNDQQDSVFFLANKKGLLGKIGKSVSISNLPSALPGTGAIKNEDEFLPYKGKIIRNIFIQKIGFNKSVYDTSNNNNNFLSKLGNALHTSTKRRIIRNNLFFSEGDSLQPNLMADNDKFIRDLSFLQDAKIRIDALNIHPDSVDIIVSAKDVFPIGGSLSEASTDFASFEFNDDNLFGTGNIIQVKNLFDTKRSPNYGVGLEFLKRNIGGTFVNIAVGYNNQNPTFNTGRLEERSIFIRGELPLVSPYHSITGAFDVSSNNAINRYVEDSIHKRLFQYNYRNIDAWIGLSIGAKKQLKYNFSSRKKQLIALRILNRDFVTTPTITLTTYDSRYSDLKGSLVSYTRFQQDFYHTNFIYGFGRNEDIPEGFNLTYTGGFTNQNDIQRLFLSIDYQRSYLSRKNSYLNYNIKVGGYYNNERIEDFIFFASAERFTKLRHLGASRWYSRHFISGSVTQQINTFLNDPLRLSSIYGLPLINNPTTNSSGRATLNAETVFYNTWSFFGFRFAPFCFANISYLKTEGFSITKGDLYSAVGSGFRTRNENLVFGTMEFKLYYFPRVVDNMNQWNFTVTTDLKFRYNSQFVNKPNIISVN